MADVANLETTVDRVDGTVTMRVVGELDLSTAPTLWVAMEEAAVASDRIVLDLSGLSFIDSSGLSVLIRAQQLLGSTRTFVFQSPSPQARRVFEVSGLTSMLDGES